MSINEINELMAEFVDLKSNNNSDTPTYTLPSTFKGIYSYKTTKELLFYTNLNWLQVVIDKISSIKSLTLAVQFYQNSCYIALLYKSQDVDGEFKNAKFSCTREKPITQYNKALFEVVGNFLGWMKGLPNYKSEIEYELGYIAANEKGQNIVYMQPKDENIEEEK